MENNKEEIIDEIKRKYEADYYYYGRDEDGNDHGAECKSSGGIFYEGVEINEDKDEVIIDHRCGGVWFKLSEYGKTWFFSEEKPEDY